MLARPVAVGVQALARMIQVRKLGRPHLVIEPTPTYVGFDDDLAGDDAMHDEFRRLGLLDRRGRPDGNLLDTLTVLARPSVEYFAWYNEHGGPPVGVLVAGLGEYAALAVRTGDTVRLTGLRNRSLAGTLVGQLPRVPPARFDPVNIRIADLRPAGDDLLIDALPDTDGDLGTVRRLRAQPVIGLGELYVAVRDGHGRRDTIERPIRYRDMRIGRALVTSSGGYLSMAPAPAELLVQKLTQALRNLTR